MAERGFSIRCPHCFQWTDWEEVDPKKVALDSEEELREILDGLHADPEGYSNDKLLQCDQPRWVCPAPIEAFVCKNDADAHRFLETVDAWSLKRDFRLYKTDHHNRWPTSVGVGILFSTQPVPPQRHIELEHLMDRALLSHAIVGIGEDLKGPFTVYAAKVFEREAEDHIYWVPVEADRPGPPKAPPRYNAFCRICRQEVIKQTVETFTAQNPSPLKCPLREGRENKTCAKIYASGKAPCEEKDWNHCPAFLELREKECPCYQSDSKMITEIEKRWWEGDASFKKPLVQKCWAGLTEIALPIVVHDHLVGVAMTGQLVMNPSDLLPVDELVGKHPILKPVRGALEDMRDLLVGEREPDEKKSDEEYTDEVRTKGFRVNKKDLRRRIEVVREGVSQIAAAAEANYRQIRGRFENIFKQELLGLVANDREAPQFFDDPICNILKRMREFWAFKGAYLWVIPPRSSQLSIIAGHRKPDGLLRFNFPGKYLGQVHLPRRPKRPIPWLVNLKDAEQAQMEPAKWLLPFLKQAINDPEVDMPKGRYYFIPLVPVADHLFAFVFARRDDQAVSPLRFDAESISQLAQDAIFSTCTDVVYEFGDILWREARERAWREFSGHASHRIGNEISTVGTLLDVLAEKLCSDPKYADRWGENLSVMQGCIRSSNQMLTQLKKLTAEVQPDRKWVDVATLIRRALLGVVPAAASVEIDISPETRKAFVDPELMEQVLRELGMNTVRIVGENVEITVRVTAEPSDLLAAPREKKARGGLYISFQDNGLGIPAEDAERIFEPFVTATPGGTGLGLTTVRRIVQAHGGDITAVPSNRGACFLISLPAEGDRK